MATREEILSIIKDGEAAGADVTNTLFYLMTTILADMKAKLPECAQNQEITARLCRTLFEHQMELRVITSDYSSFLCFLLYQELEKYLSESSHFISEGPMQ